MSKDKITEKAGNRIVSKIVDAFIGPKIDAVSESLKQRDLYIQASEENLANLTKGYLKQLSHQVSEVTSLAFPRQKLKLKDIYEPLEIRVSNHITPRFDYSVEHLLIEPKGTFLLIDNAGMGKSTFSKYLVSRYLHKSNRIPILFELRKFDANLDIESNLAKLFFYGSESIPKELFHILLSAGHFVIILDGFDEAHNDVIRQLSEELVRLSESFSENLLLITSRHQPWLPNVFDPISLTFKRLTTKQIESILLRYDSIGNRSVGQELLGELNRIPPGFLQTPLIVSLLYRTYEVNRTIASRVCTFYSEVYDALYKGHDLINKNGFSRDKKSDLDFEDFRMLLRGVCYLFSLKGIVELELNELLIIISKAEEITLREPTSSNNFLSDLLYSVPLMLKEGSTYKRKRGQSRFLYTRDLQII